MRPENNCFLFRTNNEIIKNFKRYCIFFYPIFLQLIKYFWVSVIAAIVDIGSFICFYDKLSLGYIVANILSFSLGLATNYVLSTIFVFSKEARKTATEFFLFAIIGLIGLLISHFTLFIAIGLFSMSSFPSKLFAVMTTFFWNFSARKIFLFKNKRQI